MFEVEWTKEQVIRLVKEYRNRPELWDNQHNLFKVQTANYEAYCSLAELFDCDITDLKKKLNSIFASHRRERGKVKLGGRSTWFLYPHLSFLPTHIGNPVDNSETEAKKPRKTLKTIRPVSENEEEEEDDDDDDNNGEDEQEVTVTEHSYDENGDAVATIIIKEEGSSIGMAIPDDEIPSPPKTKQSTHKPRLTRILKRKLVKGTRRDNASSSSRIVEYPEVKYIKKPEIVRKKDECDSFGEYIAISLRKHDERTQAMIKQAINNILFEQEMKKYNTSQFTVVLTGLEENPLKTENSFD